MSAWFPSGKSNSAGWRFDAVSLLAVIGESSVTLHIPALESSWLCLLPRLMPAPQALLKPSRPTRLPTVPAVVVGAYSGTRVNELNFYADIIHQVDTLQPFEFHEYNIARRATDSTLSSYRSYREICSPVMSTRTFSALHILTMMSCAMTAGLIVWACIIRDGVAIVSLVILAFTSMLVGLAMWYQPQLAIRPTDAVVPDGDIIIRTRKGAFIVVHCSEEVARELYIGTEEAKYVIADGVFGLFMGTGTVSLMVGVVLLGNCNWTMQTAIGASYLILNGAYWALGLVPGKQIWDTSIYEVRDITPRRLKSAHIQGIDGIKPSYTRTLWYTIQSTKEMNGTSWVSISGAAPETPAWGEWERLACDNRNNPSWDAVGEKDRLMELFRDREQQRPGEIYGYIAANTAPCYVPSRRETL
ncbi:hypothetical protein BJX96DRAFT_164363 [Aspergillus floccosus]